MSQSIIRPTGTNTFHILRAWDWRIPLIATNALKGDAPVSIEKVEKHE